jgi:competence protein ComEA
MRVKWKRPELLAAAVTLLFLCFTLGYFLGRNSNTGVVTIPETPLASPALSDAPPSLPAAAPDVAASPQETLASVNTPDSIETPEETAAAETHRDGAGLLRINLATAAELAELPGIGEILAERIVAYRDAHGDFKRTSSIENVSGIGEGKYNAIKDLITVD